MCGENRVIKRRKSSSTSASAAAAAVGEPRTASRKRSKVSSEFSSGKRDLFDSLPDDIVLSILSKLSSTAECPADFINVLITCKRLNGLGVHSIVLSKASQKMLAVKAQNWSESTHRFLKLCADAGNVEASYILGMIRFYCLENRGSGASLMAKAAINSHAPALYSLAVIQFNGSGGSKNDKDLRAGVALCARAAFLGHIDALRELGHCLQDGYGVKRNIAEGRRFLVQANARELANVLATTPSALLNGSWLTWNPLPHQRNVAGTSCPLLSDFGCNVPAPEPHPANKFLTDWYATTDGVPGPGLRLCCHVGCGRPESRRHEFRRCSVCGAVNYCSRACQAMDWRSRHKSECVPAERWGDDDGENVAAAEPAEAVVNGNGNGEANDLEIENEMAVS
ncbi:PREDICTED: F-box protein At1g67340-like [Ipomoea nil]|uniref:F-box protein At1g67340-like n=1 Tax=Ipomoea nil TaxID=35883 RepID=UPI000900C263|nr:PREDICTED: F-box protein At1g67340-like [Ipomoea nil]